MGLTINYFYSLTPRQFYNIVGGWQKKVSLELEISWNQMREIIYYNYLLTPLGQKKKHEKKTTFYPLIWDKNEVKKKTKVRSQEEMKKLFK